MKLHLKPLDFVIALFFCCVIAAGFVLCFKGNKGTVSLEVVTPYGRYLYPMDKMQTLEFEGHLGITRVQTGEGSARVIESCCDNKNCIGMGTLKGIGDWSACLPNGIMLHIVGQQDEEELDGIAR